MKIFQSLQKRLALFGYTRIQSQQRQNHPHPLDRQHGWKTFLSGWAIIFMCTFILHNIIDNRNECMDTVYFLTAITIIEISRASYIFKTSEIFDFIDRFENLINESK